MFNNQAEIERTKAQVDAEIAGRNYRLPQPARASTESDDDNHRNAPVPDPACLYGLIGEIANAAGETTEASPYAVALNAIAYMGAAVGRGPCMPVGNTWHHARIFGLHVGRTSRARKGDAMGLVHRVDKALRLRDEFIAPQVHRGGLSTREGLALLIHDGFKAGKDEVEPIHDKRLWIVESEFSNILQQSKRDGNTLSSALRDAWDGVSIRPATKSNRVWATDPHIAVSGAVTPSELRAMLASREMTNGFANRFLMIWSERTRLVPFPKPSSQERVHALAARMDEVLRFAGADRPVESDIKRVELSHEAQRLYEQLYQTELNDQRDGELINALLERRAPTLLRLAMLFALCDLTLVIDAPHLNAALAWIRYWRNSVKFIFSAADDETRTSETNDAAAKIAKFLANRERATRSELIRDCFQGHLSKERIDVAIDELLLATPPKIVVQNEPRPKSSPGSATKFYSLPAKSAKSANCEDSYGFADESDESEICETSEMRPGDSTRLRTIRTIRADEKPLETLVSIDTSHLSLTSQAEAEIALDGDRIEAEI